MSEPVIRLEWDAAAQLLNAAQRIIIVTHVRPDGDAIGSLLGLGLALREHDKQVTLAVDGGVPDEFQFIPGAQTVLSHLETPRADLLILTDANEVKRVGDCGTQASALGIPTIVVDHHPTATFFASATILNSGYVSATEAVLDWIDVLGWELSPDVAYALLVGLITDTQAFRVGNVTGETFRKAQRIMDMGIDLRGIVERTLVHIPTGQLPLIGRALANSKLEDHVIWASLTLRDFEAAPALKSSPDIANELLKDEAAFVAAYFHETEEGHVRMSLRCVPGFNVGNIATSLEGGGHAQAAGGTLKNISLDAAVAKVLPLLKAEAARGTPLYG